MKRLTFILSLLCLVWVQGAWGATTVYVATTGSNTSPYDTWAKAATAPHTAQTYLNGLTSNGHSMYISTGSFISYITLTDADAVNETIYGVSAAGVVANCIGGACQAYPAAKGDVLVTVTAGQHGLVTTQAGITMKNISMTGSDSTHDLFRLGADGFIGENLYGYNSGRSLFAILTGATNVNISKSRFEGANNSTNYGLNTAGTSSGTISSSIFGPSSNQPLGAIGSGGGLSLAHTATCGGGADPCVWNFNNIIITGSGYYDVNHTGAGTTYLNNGVFDTSISSGVAAIRRAAGTVGVNNSLIIPNFGTGVTASGTITETNDINNQPFWTTKAFGGAVAWTIDDTSSGLGDVTTDSYIRLLQPIFAARGQKLTWFLAPSSLDSAGKITWAQNILNDAGQTVEAGLHGRTHSNVGIANGATIWTPNSNVDIDKIAGTIKKTADSTTCVSEYVTKTLAEIKTAVQAAPCSITLTNTATSYSDADASSAALRTVLTGEVLTAGNNQGTITVDVAADGSSGLFKDEIVNGATYMGTKITIPAWQSIAYPYGTLTGLVSFGSPYGVYSTDIAALSAAQGYWVLRSTGTAYSSTILDYYATDLERIYALQAVNILPTGTAANQATVELAARAIGQFVTQYGAIVSIVAHGNVTGPIYTSELSAEQWGWFLDIFINEFPEVATGSLAQIMNTIRTGGTWANEGGGCSNTAPPLCRVYTKSRSNVSDYTLQATSPAINAGTIIPALFGTTDPSGVVMPWGIPPYPSIGAYQYRNTVATYSQPITTTGASINTTTGAGFFTQ